jgi:two-component system, sensor histidine kinase and response regulator
LGRLISLLRSNLKPALLKKRFTILICDNKPEIITVTELILRDKYNTVPCYTGDAVFQLIYQVNPDLILIDNHLPGMDGEEIVRQLKYHEATKNIPLIFFSTDNNAESVSKRVGADACLKKPFDLPEMEHLISTLLVRYSQNRSLS